MVPISIARSTDVISRPAPFSAARISSSTATRTGCSSPAGKPQDNPRFVVTNLRQTPRFIYEKVYCGRGDIENRIKELHDGLQIDRTSCSRFWANQLRVLLTAAAYVLMPELG